MTLDTTLNLRQVRVHKSKLLSATEKTSTDIFLLKWKYITSNLTSSLSGVFRENSFSDVTLVSDDLIPFQAHRYVLSALSPVLKNILLNNPHSNPLIYLRGINHQVLDSILQFIYLGEASVKEGDLNRFFQAAKDLQIKQLAENTRLGNSSEPRRDLDNFDDINMINDIDNNKDLHKSDGIDNSADIENGDDVNDSDDYYSCDTGNSDDKEKDDEFDQMKILSISSSCKEVEMDNNYEIFGIDIHHDNKDEDSGKSISLIRNDIRNLEAPDRKDSNKNIHKNSEDEGEYKQARKSESSIGIGDEHDISGNEDLGSDKKLYNCKKCGNIYNKDTNVYLKTNHEHEGISKYCECRSITKKNHKRRQKSLHERVIYSCNQCDFQFTERSNLTIHQQSIHKDASNQYENLKNKFAQSNEDLLIKKAEEILRTKNSSKVRVDDLDDQNKIYNIHQNVDADVEIENVERRLSNITEEITNLGVLAREEARKGKELNKCQKCEVNFQSVTGLQGHINSKHLGLKYSCNQCNHQTSDKGNLSKHKKSVHEGIKYSCNKCDFQFSDRSNLKKHQRSIHEGETHSCDQCNYTCKGKNSLWEHKKSVHVGVKYPCNQCGFQSTRKDKLKTHKESVHQGFKYFCDQCNYRTGRKDKLKVHKVRIHT